MKTCTEGRKFALCKKSYFLKSYFNSCWLKTCTELESYINVLDFACFYRFLLFFGKKHTIVCSPVHGFLGEWSRLLLVSHNCPWVRRWVQEIYCLRRRLKCELWPTFEFPEHETGPWTDSNTNCQYGPSITKIVPLQAPCCP